MATELELKMLARLRAHEVLIQNLLRLAFNYDPNAVREFSARQSGSLDTARLPDLDPAMPARLPYETQEGPLLRFSPEPFVTWRATCPVSRTFDMPQGQA